MSIRVQSYESYRSIISIYLVTRLKLNLIIWKVGKIGI